MTGFDGMEAFAPGEPMRMTAWVHGHVQGVGFRWWTRSQALELGLDGYAKNMTDGRVCVVAEGTPALLEALLRRLSEQPSAFDRPGTVSTVVPQYSPPRGVRGFSTR